MKGYNFVNVKDLNQLEQPTSLKVSSLDHLKQKITLPINHREIAEALIEQNVDLYVEKDTDLGKTNNVRMSIDNGKHSSIKLTPQSSGTEHWLLKTNFHPAYSWTYQVGWMKAFFNNQFQFQRIYQLLNDITKWEIYTKVYRAPFAKHPIV